jgi:hydroxymethylglutaryl-CoA lyase
MLVRVSLPGPVSVDAIVDMVRRFRDLGCDEIDIADTIGVGTVDHVQEVIQAAAKEFPLERLAGHFHDTYGQALANIVGALQVGMSIFHASVGGLGGCPYAKGATGNVATEDLLYLLNGLGIETGIDLDAVVTIGDWVSQQMDRANGGRAGKALMAKRASN